MASQRDPFLPPRHAAPRDLVPTAQRGPLHDPAAAMWSGVEEAERRELARISGQSPYSHDVTDVLQVLNQLKGSLAENRSITEEIGKPLRLGRRSLSPVGLTG